MNEASKSQENGRSWLAEQFRTTTFLLTLRYMILFFVSATLLMAVINWAILGYMEKRSDEALLASLRTFVAVYQQGGIEAAQPIILARNQSPSSTDPLYLLADRQFRAVNGNFRKWPQLESLDDGWVEFSEQIDGEEDAILNRGRVVALGPEVWLLVARRVQSPEDLTRVLERSFTVVLGITLVLSFIGGLLMSSNVLRRVNAINDVSRNVMAGDLSQRMPTRGTPDEFDQLARNLNAMLDQIESLMSSVRHVSDNIAHDLRTPLTRLRNRLETLHGHASSEHSDEIMGCIEDADALLSTFSSLLSIARLESGAAPADGTAVNLSRLTNDACDLYAALAEEKSISLECMAEDHVHVPGDRNLIFQALTNLLDNAVKYTTVGGHIDVSLSEGLEGVCLTVADNGPGIPEDKRERVIERFARLDRSRSMPGAGLGLSLVNAIAHQQGAELRLEDNQPGLRISLVFPSPITASSAEPAAREPVPAASHT